MAELGWYKSDVKLCVSAINPVDSNYFQVVGRATDLDFPDIVKTRANGKECFSTFRKGWIEAYSTKIPNCSGFDHKEPKVVTKDNWKLYHGKQVYSDWTLSKVPPRPVGKLVGLSGDWFLLESKDGTLDRITFQVYCE